MSAFDAVVIGAGAGGLTAAIGLTGLGKSVAMVEAGAIGGDCTNVGCIPSKTLIHHARAGTENPLSVTRARRDELRDRETDEMRHVDGLEVVVGRGRLVASDTVEVDLVGGETRRLEAPHIIICTGSRPRPLDIPGLPDDLRLTNETLWDLPRAPGRLAIVGGGPIGLEMAFAFSRLGSEVLVAEAADRVLAAEEPAVTDVVERSLKRTGVDLRVGTTVTGFDPDGNRLLLGDGSAVEAVDHVLVAAGRTARVDDLGLEAIGVETDRRGIVTDGWGRTSVDRVWAVGDVTGRTATTHAANAMGRRVVQAIGLPFVPRIGGPPVMPAAVFAEPEVASVGAPWEELADRDDVVRLEFALADTDRGYTDDIGDGLVVVHAQRLTGRVLRAAIVGPAAAEAIGLFTLAIERGVGLHRIYRMVHPYPTYAGAIGKVADAFAAQTLPNLAVEAKAWARGLPARLGRR